MKMLKIYVCYHKDFDVEKVEGLIPIQVGAEINPKLSNKIYDNSGKNISSLNKSYCELTALYWAWKNEISDYYGLFHYRRYLIFSKKMINDYRGNKYKNPYKCFKYPTAKILKKVGYEKKFKDIITEYDIIMPIPEDMHVSVYSHYINSNNHNKKDLDLVCKIIKNKYPEYAQAMELYLNNSLCYFGNIFVANSEIFHNYCKWLFDILDIFDNKKDITGYNDQELRVNGYLGERLLGIYFTWLKINSNIRWAELPRAHFEYMGNDKCIFYRKKILNFILPPGSKRRMIIKKIKAI
ncbi:DUF4422 domain-containing protein [Clostridium botulinum]|uniref:DUF4422 domain-containing protein n=1 Tax=Clostridium botulinum TaxID=1491 RepID=UPI0013F078F4|nr:DUF4422 domain-containing protein [Clostridium botulinum]MCS6103220.1 DUF4422 domain-containing protein [Clostridium botulinum]MCS6106761.1 DUF4422 domain-containing protein [Clostridium botulinum]NFO33672.1 DUF4422 domain-containing protein [Clostridium botulinum]